MFCVRFAKNSTSCRREFLSRWECDSTIDRDQNVSCNVLIFSLNESSWTWDLWCWSNCELFTWSNFSTRLKWDCDSELYRINRFSRRAASNETNRFKKKWWRLKSFNNMWWSSNVSMMNRMIFDNVNELSFDVYETSDELYTLCMRIIFVFFSISLTIILNTLKSIVKYSIFQLSMFI
jgi:hypothetical protein